MVDIPLDFHGDQSGGRPMDEAPPDNEDGAPNYPESPFLIRLWEHLDAAAELSVVAGVLGNLDEIADHCQGAIDEIRAWQRDGPT
jgi:hypothetical protein